MSATVQTPLVPGPLQGPTIQQRIRRGRRFAITITALTTAGILASLLMS